MPESRGTLSAYGLQSVIAARGYKSLLSSLGSMALEGANETSILNTNISNMSWLFNNGPHRFNIKNLANRL